MNAQLRQNIFEGRVPSSAVVLTNHYVHRSVFMISSPSYFISSAVIPYQFPATFSHSLRHCLVQLWLCGLVRSPPHIAFPLAVTWFLGSTLSWTYPCNIPSNVPTLHCSKCCVSHPCPPCVLFDSACFCRSTSNTPTPTYCCSIAYAFIRCTSDQFTHPCLPPIYFLVFVVAIASFKTLSLIVICSF